jgi:hypothetical protein
VLNTDDYQDLYDIMDERLRMSTKKESDKTTTRVSDDTSREAIENAIENKRFLVDNDTL